MPWGFSVANPGANQGLFLNDAARACVAQVELAHRWHHRLIGLLGRAALAPNHALWIRPCNSVHTFGMRFAIDVVFLDADRTVVRVEHNVVPWRVARARAASVLELAAGVARRVGVDVGDRLHIRATEAPPNFGESLA